MSEIGIRYNKSNYLGGEFRFLFRYDLRKDQIHQGNELLLQPGILLFYRFVRKESFYVYSGIGGNIIYDFYRMNTPESNQAVKGEIYLPLGGELFPFSEFQYLSFTLESQLLVSADFTAIRDFGLRIEPKVGIMYYFNSSNFK